MNPCPCCGCHPEWHFRPIVIENENIMIKIICFSNLDEYKAQEWPDQLPAVPKVGQWLQAKSGKRLRIVNTTWLYSGELEVELHKGF